jgi:hypothetical protein
MRDLSASSEEGKDEDASRSALASLVRVALTEDYNL